nr:uncharacterized protein LOC111988678 isoform X2 [Quercus suber]
MLSPAPMRLSPAIDSSPPIPIGSLYRRPIPIGSLSLTTRSFLPFSLSPLTTPIPIHFSSPYPYPYPFRFCLKLLMLSLLCFQEEHCRLLIQRNHLQGLELSPSEGQLKDAR